MDRHRINIPGGTLTNEEMEQMAAKLFTCGYAIKKGKYVAGSCKGVRYIEYWVDADASVNKKEEDTQ